MITSSFITSWNNYDLVDLKLSSLIYITLLILLQEMCLFIIYSVSTGPNYNIAGDYMNVKIGFIQF